MRSQHAQAPKTIAVLMDTDFAFGSRILEGVQAFAGRSTRWRVLPLHGTQDALLDELLSQRRIDGVVGSFVSDRWVSGLDRGTIPVVNVGNASEIRSVPSVVCDDAAVGRLAAAHLTGRGWTRLGALHDPASNASRQRLAGFRGGTAGDVATPPRGTGYATDATWDEWIRGLPVPFAVFCTSDFLARRFVQRVVACGRRVPDDVAVIGVGDSVLDSVLAGVPLSSVALPAMRVGERAAERLRRLLEGASDDGEPELVPPERMALRESSACLFGHGPLVARALAFLEGRLGDALDVATLAAACGASRRLLELRFREELGQGPAALLRNKRHALACRLLAETELPLVDVARAAGHAEPARFWTVFKAREGCTPGAYRAASAARRGTQPLPARPR